jgi:hypothetical protein
MLLFFYNVSFASVLRTTSCFGSDIHCSICFRKSIIKASLGLPLDASMFERTMYCCVDAVVSPIPFALIVSGSVISSNVGSGFAQTQYAVTDIVFFPALPATVFHDHLPGSSSSPLSTTLVAHLPNIGVNVPPGCFYRAILLMYVIFVRCKIQKIYQYKTYTCGVVYRVRVPNSYLIHIFLRTKHCFYSTLLSLVL